MCGANFVAEIQKALNAMSICGVGKQCDGILLLLKWLAGHEHGLALGRGRKQRVFSIMD